MDVKYQGIKQQASAVMRGLNMTSKFLVLFVAAKYLSVESLGFFGIYWTVVVLAASLLGLNIYTYTVRAMLSSSSFDSEELLSHHYSSLLVVLLGMLPLIFIYALYAWQQEGMVLAFVLVLHVFFEVIAQENSRFLIGMGRPFQAALANFLRGFIWSLFAMLYLLLWGKESSVLAIAIIWVLFSLVSMVFSFFLMIRAEKLKLKWRPSFSWVMVAIKVSSKLLVATLLFRVIVGGDRLIVENLVSDETVGVYIYYSLIVFAIVGIIEAGVSTWHYPRLVKSIRTRQTADIFDSYADYQRAVGLSAIAMLVVVNLIVFITANYFLDRVFLDNYKVFFLLSIGALSYSLSMPAHYVIYGAGYDRLYLYISFAATALFIFLCLFLSTRGGIEMMAIAFSSALVFFAISKYCAASVLKRKFKEIA
ncbi:hypothetical protein QAO71_09645 [Halopseudomonas sp. SMJS2]|uniref:lipopolysaccharide biosynthesis protein n=1 Tax=Halopseudomonas sp. SMJS2 TaxID=3041098 RepID=UPI002453686C|nr:hypothetical protein [Halopseudomonas sp. SMJS2]WGK60363.1 hypothetical protein QAO71_09645 [Halopseudomonas sp. SMJS2]